MYAHQDKRYRGQRTRQSRRQKQNQQLKKIKKADLEKGLARILLKIAVLEEDIDLKYLD